MPFNQLILYVTPCLQSSQHQGLFQWVSSSHQVAKVLELQHQSFQWIFRIDFLYDWLVGSPCSPKDSRESSPTPLLHPYMTTGKTIALTRQTFVTKVMSLLFNMLSKFVTAFLPRSKHLLISWLQSPSTVILELKKIKSVTVSCISPTILPWSDGTSCHDLHFLKVEFWANLSLSSFTFKRLFSLSSLSSVRVVSSAYLRLFIFLLPVLIPVCGSSSPAFSHDVFCI